MDLDRAAGPSLGKVGVEERTTLLVASPLQKSPDPPLEDVVENHARWQHGCVTVTVYPSSSSLIWELQRWARRLRELAFCPVVIGGESRNLGPMFLPIHASVAQLAQESRWNCYSYTIYLFSLITGPSKCQKRLCTCIPLGARFPARHRSRRPRQHKGHFQWGSAHTLGSADWCLDGAGGSELKVGHLTILYMLHVSINQCTQWC